MNKITLKQAIKIQTDNVELSSLQLDNLMRLQKTPAIDNTDAYVEQSNSKKYKKHYAAVATVLMVFAIGFFFSISNTPVIEKIAAEVSSNHLKLKPLEVNTDQLIDLDNYFTLLDFKLVSTGIMENPNWTLLGARYCSIQGNTAAQLQLKNKQTGAIETLYQAPFNQKQFSTIPILENNQTPAEAFVHGIAVKIWVEKGVLFALTKSSVDS